MNLDKQKKRQSLRIIISEAIMVLAVIATVVVLAFIVSGYWINSDFEVERQGMLQISSVPTGATINIDGEESSWLQRTNTSKVLSAGEHTVTLTKDGYDSWSKTVDVKEGLLYRLHYPRLFLQNRTPEQLLSLTGATVATISPNRDSLIVANDTTKWGYLELDTDNPQLKTLNIAEYFSGVSLAEKAETGLFTGEILSIDWDYDGSHALFNVKTGDNTEWVLLDVNSPNKSLNLTREFGAKFDRIEIIDNSSNNLIAIQSGNLHKIDIANRQISAVLVENVIDFDHYRNEIVFTAKSTESTAKETLTDYYLGYFKIGDSEITELSKLSSPAKVVISKFYDDRYITILQDNLVRVHKKDDFNSFTDYELTFAPESIEVGHDGEFITMYSGTKIATLDMEASLVREWSVEGNTFDWIDNDMIYSVSDGELIVYDFDGFNRRILAKNVSAHFPAGITDNKWLYYLSDDNLVRELIAS